MGCWKQGGPGRWYGMENARERWCGRSSRRSESSGNTAFDEYREETLRRLEEEQNEFQSFLEQLRQAKDKAEFDQFMDDRRRRAAGPDEPEGPADDDHGGPRYPRSPEGSSPPPAG